MRSAKVQARRRRGARARHLIARARKVRMVVHRSGQHTYAQLVDPDCRVLASASTAEREMRKQFPAGNTVAAASAVGERLAGKVKAGKLPTKVVFDRSGFKFHGRVKALLDGALANGMEV